MHGLQSTDPSNTSIHEPFYSSFFTAAAESPTVNSIPTMWLTVCHLLQGEHSKGKEEAAGDPELLTLSTKRSSSRSSNLLRSGRDCCLLWQAQPSWGQDSTSWRSFPFRVWCPKASGETWKGQVGQSREGLVVSLGYRRPAALPKEQGQARAGSWDCCPFLLTVWTLEKH